MAGPRGTSSRSPTSTGCSCGGGEASRREATTLERYCDAMTAAILLMGPTASGKSALAMALAERFDGEIVSVDSAQVYRGMDIGTAKPDASTRARRPHHLLDLVDPTESYSAARFAHDAVEAIDGLRGRRHV